MQDQPQLQHPRTRALGAGYSFRWIGSNATRIVIPKEVMELDAC